jgi:hypothetical protein
MTLAARAAWSSEPGDWLDRSGLRRSDVLVLPYDPPYFAWTLEAWNRDFGRPIRLDVEDPRTDPFGAEHASVRSDGTLLAEGRPLGAGGLVVNDFGSRIALAGARIAQRRPAFTAFRVPAGVRVVSLAEGLYRDGWMAPRLRFRVWRGGGPIRGRYVIGLRLPAGTLERRFTVTLGGESRTLRLDPGERTELVVPVDAPAGVVPELIVRASGGEVADGRTANPRIVAARVTELRFEPSTPGAAA